MKSEYKTVKTSASGEYTVKRSRFIGYACPVSTSAEAESFIASIKSKHYDATHNVYAYILREGGIKRYSDDGEPQGTAGIPALDVLEKEGLVDTAVVVTRYFGGILLGGGGLVRAYSHSAKVAVDSAGVITMAPCTDAQTVCDYGFYGKLSAFLAAENVKVLDTDFSDSVKVVFRIKSADFDALSEKLTDLSNGKSEIRVISENFCEF